MDRDSLVLMMIIDIIHIEFPCEFLEAPPILTNKPEHSVCVIIRDVDVSIVRIRRIVRRHDYYFTRYVSKSLKINLHT